MGNNAVGAGVTDAALSHRPAQPDSSRTAVTSSTSPRAAWARFDALAWFGPGSWRLVLATLVAASHLWVKMVQGPAAYAVWGFYVLSGFLMTYVLTEKYGFTSTGIKRYAYNRFLRIYPGYWIALGLGILVFGWVTARGIDPTLLNPEYYLPRGSEWLNPITLFPLFPHTGLPVAVSNALAIEIGAYLLMPLLARSRAAAWSVAIVSLLISTEMGLDAGTFATRYATLLPALLPFAVGSLICHYRDRLTALRSPNLSLVAWGVHAVLWWWLPMWPWTYGLYASVILSGWVTLSLTPRRPGRFDALMGDLSYPVYLLHTIVGAALLGIWGYERPFRYFALSFVVTIVLSCIMVFAIERPLRRLKKPGALRSTTGRSRRSSAAGAPVDDTGGHDPVAASARS